MKGMTMLAATLALALFATRPVDAAAAPAAAASTAAASTAVDAVHRIAVVNDFDAPIVVYAEDSEGTLHEVVSLKPGEVRLVNTEVEGSALRLHAHPTNSADRYSTWGDTGVATEPLDVAEDDTVVFWIAPELARSLVEIRGL